MFQSVILGLIQGVAEWLPISSEGILVLVQTNWFGVESLSAAIDMAVFLHLGTFLAALIYLRRDAMEILRQVWVWRQQSRRVQKKLWFYIITTGLSAVIAGVLLLLIRQADENLVLPTNLINLVIAGLLFITAYLQLRRARFGARTEERLGVTDGLWVGVGQGLAALPGISRSGTTTAILLLRGIREEDALRVSFLLSLPIVLAGNILLGLGEFAWSWSGVVALLVALVSGYITIHGLLRLARSINFGWFVLGFAILLVGSVFI